MTADDRGHVDSQASERLEDVVRRLQERWGPKPAQPKPKLTLIQGGRKD